MQLSFREIVVECIQQRRDAETEWIGSWQSCLVLGLFQSFSGCLFIQAMGDKGQTNNLAWTFWPHPAHGILVQLKHTLQRWQGAVFIALDPGGSGDVTEDHRVRHGTMDQ